MSKFFKKLFSSKETQILVPPEKMDPGFTPDESRKYNNKTIDPDAVHAEYIKYGASDLFIETSETGNYLEDIRLGILTPLAKPLKNNEKVKV